MTRCSLESLPFLIIVFRCSPVSLLTASLGRHPSILLLVGIASPIDEVQEGSYPFSKNREIVQGLYLGPTAVCRPLGPALHPRGWELLLHPAVPLDNLVRIH